MKLEQADLSAAVWVYAHDLVGEGAAAVAQRLSATAGASVISMATSYHAGMVLLPHNPLGRVRFLEDGALYYRPDRSRFEGTPLQPRVSSLVREGDVLEACCQAARSEGLEAAAWLVCLHNSYLGERHPQYTLQNAFGDRYIFGLCPSNEAVGSYLKALVADVSSRFPLSYLDIEALHFMGFNHGFHHQKTGIPLDDARAFLLSLCFCPSCLRRAAAAGVDAEKVRELVRGQLEACMQGEIADFQGPALLDAVAAAIPGLHDYLLVQQTTITTLAQELASISRVPIKLLMRPGAVTDPRLLGMDLPTLAQHCQAIRVQCYSSSPEETSADLQRAREILGDGVAIEVALSVLHPSTLSEEGLACNVVAAAREGVCRFSFYHYGMMPLSRLPWIKTSLRQAEAQLQPSK